MKFKQSRLATNIEFGFEEEELEYSMKDNTSALKFEIRYWNIPKRSQTFYERNEWLRNVGFLWLALGVFFTIMKLVQDGAISINVWLYVGLMCLAVYRFTCSEYTYFDTDEGRVLVLMDKQADEILNEISNRRKIAYLNWFESLNIENFDQLGQSLDYMVTEKIFTREEANARLDEMKTGAQLRLDSSDDKSDQLLQ